MTLTPPIDIATATALALLDAIVNADAAYDDAAELDNDAAIDQGQYQRAADALHEAIDSAADFLDSAPVRGNNFSY